MSRQGRVGWCPSVVTPMAAGDGLLVRVKPPAATIPAAALRALAEAAGRCGNGLIDLTNRGNLQVRGLRPETAEAFAEIVRNFGLAGAEPALEEVRNVAADPLGRDDPDALFDSHAVARSIEAMLGETRALRALPPKFGFVVDCSPTMPVPVVHADIVLRERDCNLTVAVAGGTTALICTPPEAADLARRLALAFLDLAGDSTFRMRELVAALGEDAILARTGFDAPVAHALSASCPGSSRVSTSGRPEDETVDGRDEPGHDGEGDESTDIRAARLALMYAPAPADSPVGYVPFPGRDAGAVVAGVPRGRIEAPALAALAELSGRFADGTIRMTPWRALAFVPVSGDNASAFLNALSALGLITDPTDPRRAWRGPDIEPASGPLVRPEAIAP